MHSDQTLQLPAHSRIDNLQGQLFGIVMAAFGVSILKAAGLVTGQTAGLSILISYASGWSFGTVFFVLNLPFYAFALKRMGVPFTIRSFISATAISLMADVLPHYIQFGELNIFVAAIVASCTASVGLIALFRHGASAGGLGMLALYIQDKSGFKAGWFQLLIDLCIFAVSFLVIDSMAVLASLFGAIILNTLIALNHRKDWYVAQ
ncbi:YitT family protein [Roseibium litorale]|uniref:YitT family protein n=1 Tax=Roseibium litorale TaxID=2803841 RepID=A0ABR9CT15_9HYPH|nr:YitT family protein [Roseibium litorale]MBD8894015.1 YitT family protein [Roseibium litorale]